MKWSLEKKKHIKWPKWQKSSLMNKTFFKAFNMEIGPILLHFIINTWLEIDNISLYYDNFMAWPNLVPNFSKNLKDFKVLYPLIIPTDFNVSNLSKHPAEFKVPNPPKSLKV